MCYYLFLFNSLLNVIAYVWSVSSRKLDNYVRLTTENRRYYYLDPALAYERIQVKYLPNQLEIYYEEGTHIMTIHRISGSLV